MSTGIDEGDSPTLPDSARRPYKASLKTCSLLSKTFLAASRPALFHEIVLNTNRRYTDYLLILGSDGLSEAVIASVQVVVIMGHQQERIHISRAGLAVLANKLPSLHTVCIKCAAWFPDSGDTAILGWFAAATENSHTPVACLRSLEIRRLCPGVVDSEQNLGLSPNDIQQILSPWQHVNHLLLLSERAGPDTEVTGIPKAAEKRAFMPCATVSTIELMSPRVNAELLAWLADDARLRRALRRVSLHALYTPEFAALKILGCAPGSGLRHIEITFGIGDPQIETYLTDEGIYGETLNLGAIKKLITFSFNILIDSQHAISGGYQSKVFFSLMRHLSSRTNPCLRLLRLRFVWDVDYEYEDHFRIMTEFQWSILHDVLSRNFSGLHPGEKTIKVQIEIGQRPNTRHWMLQIPTSYTVPLQREEIKRLNFLLTIPWMRLRLLAHHGITMSMRLSTLDRIILPKDDI